GVAVLAARSFAGTHLVDSLTATASAEPAAQSAWNILTSLLAGIGQAMVGYGVVIVFGAWVAGPGTFATELRRGMTPGLRDRRVAYGALALILLLVFWWDPTQGTSRLGPSLVLIVLAIAGVEGIRLQAVRDFPDATWEEASARWRERIAGLRAGAGRQLHRAGGEAATATVAA